VEGVIGEVEFANKGNATSAGARLERRLLTSYSVRRNLSISAAALMLTCSVAACIPGRPALDMPAHAPTPQEMA
jgi:hypothetical protein